MVQAVGGHVYAGGSSGLSIIDVTNPAVPVEVGVLATTIISDVKVEAGLAYVLGYDSARIIDVSNPEAPVELGAYSGGGNEVEIENGLVFFGTRNGMQIVDFGPEFVPEPSGILLRFTALAVVGFLARTRVRRGRHINPQRFQFHARPGAFRS